MVRVKWVVSVVVAAALVLAGRARSNPAFDLEPEDAFGAWSGGNARGLRRRRVGAALALAILVLASATGCDVLQGKRPDPGVMALTVEDGTVTFMWCGDDAQFDTFWIQSKHASQSSTLATDGYGRYRLLRGQTFTAESPPDGPDYSVRGPIPTQNASSIYVGTLSNDDSGPSFRTAFNDVDLRSLPDGMWVTGDGDLTEEPCPHAGTQFE